MIDNRSTLLRCALDLFAARGYDAVGVQEVVEAAGVTKPTLYHYFGNKQGLLNALLDMHHEPFLEEVRLAAHYTGDLPGTLEKLARTFFGFASRYPAYYRLQLALYFAPHGSEAYIAMAGRNDQYYRLVEAVFAAAVVQHGNMRDRSQVYAATFIGMLNTCIGLWLNGRIKLDDQLIYRTLHQFQHGIYS